MADKKKKKKMVTVFTITIGNKMSSKGVKWQNSEKNPKKG
mgnify:CR=1 FL=1